MPVFLNETHDLFFRMHLMDNPMGLSGFSMPNEFQSLSVHVALAFDCVCNVEHTLLMEIGMFEQNMSYAPLFLRARKFTARFFFRKRNFF